METLLADAMKAAATGRLLLPPALKGVKDWLVRDATSIQLNESLADVYPGTRYAGLKVHKTYSLGLENLVGYQLSAASEHDSHDCPIDKKLSGDGLLVDLAYASQDFIHRCRKFDVRFVMKLKSHWR